MNYTPENIWAVIVAVVAMMMLGYAWYSMGMFGRTWMMLIGKQEADLKKGAGKAIGAMLLLAIVQALTISLLFDWTGLAYELMNGLMFGFVLSVGLLLPIMLSNVLFEQRPIKLFWINFGYQLVSVLITASIISAWK